MAIDFNPLHWGSNALHTITGGRAGTDYDLVGGVSVAGGKRKPVNNAWVGKTETQKAPAPGGGGGGGGWGVSNGGGGGGYAIQDSYGGGYGGGGYGGGGPQADPNRIKQYDQSIGVLESAIGRLGGQFNIARDNIYDQYNVNQNRLNSAKQRADREYNEQTVGNRQQLRGNKNVITDQAAQSLQGAMRLLGMYGAGGSSERELVGDAVASEATSKNSGAGENFAKNQRTLDTNIFNFREEDKNQRKQLVDWRTKSVREAEQQRYAQEQDLRTKLAQLRGEKAQYEGGDYAGAAAADINAANALSGKIDNLGRFRPTFDGKTPVYQRAALSSYNTGNGIDVGSATPIGGPATPFLQALLSDQEKEKQL